MPIDKKKSLKGKSSAASDRGLKQTATLYNKKTSLLEEAITQMNAGKYGRSSSALKELLAMDPHNMEARRLFATLHLRLGSLIPARQAFDSLIDEAFTRQDYWLAESLLREYLAAGPRCVPYLEKLAAIQQDKGETLEAVEQYGKAIDILAEDPDPDNPNHAAQLYEKIKSLAPASAVATRVAGYFNSQTGALIARSSDDSGTHDSIIGKASAVGGDSEPMAEIGAWGKAEEPYPADEAAALPDASGIPSDANGFAPQFEEAAEAVAETLPIPDSVVVEPETMYAEPELASTVSDDPVGFALQQGESRDTFSQGVQTAPEEQAVSAPMSCEDSHETNSGISGQAVGESSEAMPFMPIPAQPLPDPSSGVVKEGAVSWDALFKNALNSNSGSVLVTQAPLMNAPPVGTVPLSEPNTAQAPSAGAPMPWDQVQDATIRISQGQADAIAAEPPIEQAAPAVSATETMTWSYQEPVAEQDPPLSFAQPVDEASGAAEFSIDQSPPAQPLFGADSVSNGLSPMPSFTEHSVDSQETARQPFTFGFAGEAPGPMEDKSSEAVWNSADQSSTLDEGAPQPTPYEPVSFSLQGGSVETVPEPYTNGTEPVAAPEQASPGNVGGLSHWMPGQVSDQQDRHSSTQEHTQQEEWSRPAFIEAKAPVFEPSPKSEEPWSKPAEPIRFVQDQPADSAVATAPKRSLLGAARASESASPVASAVDALFESPSGPDSETEPRERAKPSRPRRKSPGVLSRIGSALSSFIGSCFSTTRAIVMSIMALVVLSCAVAALGIGAVGGAWVIMEESPSPAYQAFTASSPQTMSDPNKNGYVFLMGFDAPAGQNPFQAGYESAPDGADADKVLACLGSSGDGAQAVQANASEKVLSGWFRGLDPAGQFTANQGTISRWANQGEGMLGRYRRWQKLPFEDWGYGRAAAPPCAAISFAHHLYIAEGFAQHTDIGIDRLETDMEAWRAVLVQAKTLPVKVLAIQAVRDDAAVAAGLLARPDFDDKYVGRLSHMLRPLSQAELSIRWPMQSELVWAAKSFDAQVKAKKREGQPLHAAVASVLPLPSQRRLNSYAAYYEAAHKASEEGQHGALPKLGSFIKSPVATGMDYFTNPIENVIGLNPLPAWDIYNGLAVDADAHLRLASLQVWIRRGWQDAELLSRIAKAGQTFYDPYTGLPMLVNLKKRVLYSVGHDLKDQDGDLQNDVVVAIPGNPAFSSSRSSSDSPMSH